MVKAVNGGRIPTKIPPSRHLYRKAERVCSLAHALGPIALAIWRKMAVDFRLARQCAIPHK
jgi:hypothetical protein